MAPFVFLAISACLNIVLDLWFVAGLHRGVAGAAEATVLSQYVSGIGIAVYTRCKFPKLLKRDRRVSLRLSRVKEITRFSALTCLQQSVMNLGILAVQGLVNSFGPVIMAAFAAAVKIDAFAYLPVQDFGHAFSTFVSQNYGAKQTGRIQKRAFGRRSGFPPHSAGFSPLLVCALAGPLMGLFVHGSEGAVIGEGVRYLRIEGAFYCLIGALFCCTGCIAAWENPACRWFSHGCVSGRPGGLGLCALCRAGHRRCRNLVGGSHRLVLSGCPGPGILCCAAQNMDDIHGPGDGSTGVMYLGALLRRLVTKWKSLPNSHLVKGSLRFFRVST